MAGPKFPCPRLISEGVKSTTNNNIASICDHLLLNNLKAEKEMRKAQKI